MSYSYNKQCVINKVKGSINNIQEIYREALINYRGKTSDTKEYYTEVIAEELLKNDISGKMCKIKEIVRGSGYKVANHDGVSLTISNRKEEIYCKELYSLSSTKQKCFNEIGMIIDYQVPLKNKQTDKVGKIDLISKTKDAIWILELKVIDNKETVLRCLLEITTYYQVISKNALIGSYPEFSGYSIGDIRKGILVLKGSSQETELEEMKCGKRDNLKKLMEILEVEAFTIDDNYDVKRA